MKTPAISIDAARLLSAAAVIRQRGHLNCQGHMTEGPICIMQALAIVDGLQHWNDPVPPQALLDVIDEGFHPSYIAGEEPELRVAFFNDAICGGTPHAIAVLTEAAEAS